MELFSERVSSKAKTKKKRDAFSSMHPFIEFFFFLFALTITMLVMHPVTLVVSLVSAFAFALYLRGKKAVRFFFTFVLPVMLITSVLNPLFNHAGVTMLFYLSNGNPVTLEAIYYGLAASCMFGSVLLWFSCYNHVMTSDKFIYIFGKIIPALSLLLSMALRFVPRFSQKIRETGNAQTAIGRDAKSGNVFKRIYCGLRVISITITWALESAVVTADSMKSRGYGKRERTAYSIYRFDSRDAAFLIVMALTAILFVADFATGGIYFRYYPSVRMNATTILSVSGQLAFFVFCNLPVMLNIREDMVWKSLGSKI